MITLQLISIAFMVVGTLLLLALVFYYVKKITPIPSGSQHVRHIALDDLLGVDKPEAEAGGKETPATSQLNLPPMLGGSRPTHSPTLLSGMGSSWKPIRNLAPKRYRRFPHQIER